MPENWNSIQQNLLALSEHSKLVARLADDDQAVLNYLAAMPVEAVIPLQQQYAGDSRPVNSIRSLAADQLVNGRFDGPGIAERFRRRKREEPKRFTTYRDLFAVFYPFINASVNGFQKHTLEQLAKDLRHDLGLDGEAKISVVDFNGARHISTAHAWFAIYNNTHPTQETAKQLFFNLHDGRIEYALYDYKNRNRIARVSDKLPESLSYEELLEFYKRYRRIIVVDFYQADATRRYPLDQIVADLEQGKRRAWIVKPGAQASFWNTFLKEGNVFIGWGWVIRELQESGDKSEDRILELLLKYHEGDTTPHNDKKSIHYFVNELNLGDVIFAFQGVQKIVGVGIETGELEMDEDEDEYCAYREVDWLADLQHHPLETAERLPIKTVTELNKKTAISYLKTIFKMQEETRTQLLQKMAKNTILYGPPGTGKTFKLQKDYASLFESGYSDSDDLAFKREVRKYSWWQIIAAAMYGLGPSHVPDLREFPIIKAKFQPSEKRHQPDHIIWTILKSKPDLFEKPADGLWSVKKEEVADHYPEVIQLYKLKNSDTINKILDTPFSNYTFITFHQSYSYQDFVVGIKPVLSASDAEESDEHADVGQHLQFTLSRGKFYQACLAALELMGYSSFSQCYEDTFENRKARVAGAKPYALFIDEINRANISAVFGELITLIGGDKRIGTVNELWLELPGSGEKFCVPSNLYIIGTMNTADKSIALLDIALRRRFQFVGMYPEYDMAGEHSQTLRELNKAIYKEKKSADFLIGHAFFMKDGVAQPLAARTEIYNRKIIPLLMEYFGNKTDIVQRVLAEADILCDPPRLENNFQIIAQ